MFLANSFFFDTELGIEESHVVQRGLDIIDLLTFFLKISSWSSDLSYHFFLLADFLGGPIHFTG